MQTTATEAAAQTVELCDNELRAFAAEMASLGRAAGSLRISVGPKGMRMQVDGGSWTPAFGYVDTPVQTQP